MTKNFIRLFIVLLASHIAYAGSGSGKVTFLLTNHDTSPNWVVFNISGYANHACPNPNQSSGKLKFDLSTEKGMGMLSLLLSAEARDKTVTVRGAGACIAQNREEVIWISIGNPQD